MRVLISGGGTGGHIYPALSVATQLRDLYQADILYLGSDDGLETTIVPAAHLQLAVIKAGKLRRYLSWSTFKGVARVPVGMLQAVDIVRKFRPDVAFTSGGYVAVPTGLAARLNGVPLLMHQQDVPPNLSNKLLAPLATCISIAFAASQRYFPAHKTRLLGNPLRQEILDVRQVTPLQARSSLGFDAELPVLLVTGGSQGARSLNQAVCRALPQLLGSCQILQISGTKLFAETQALAEQTMAGLDVQMRQRYRLVPYMSEEMPLALQAAEIVLCRSGASTISELAALQKPCILVPLPPSMGHSPQEANAATLAAQQAAEVIYNADLRAEVLVERVTTLLAQPARLQRMQAALGAFARPEATQAIIETIITMAKSGTVTKKPEQEVLSF
jgi:UDP-N-acetylglucosamine--N-acetylmuramyl-(pentapeptide) pyrophosphoryl-undecaprenol N-acetylglucosamine transferase